MSKAPKLISKTAFNNCDIHARQPKADRYRSNAFCLGISQNVFHMLISGQSLVTHNRTLAKTFMLSRIPKVKIDRTIKNLKKSYEQLGKRKNVLHEHEWLFRLRFDVNH